MKIGVACGEVLDAMSAPDLAHSISELSPDRSLMFRYFLVELAVKLRFYIGDGADLGVAGIVGDNRIRRFGASGRVIVTAALRAARDDCDLDVRH